MLVACGEVRCLAADPGDDASHRLCLPRPGHFLTLGDFGSTNFVADQSSVALRLLVVDIPAVGAASAISTRVDITLPADLGSHQPDGSAGLQVGQRLEQGVDQIPVVLAEPEQDDIHRVVRVVAGEFLAGQFHDGVAEGVVTVVVVAELQHDRAALEAEPARHVRLAALAVRVVRGRAHVSSSVVPAARG